MRRRTQRGLRRNLRRWRLRRDRRRGFFRLGFFFVIFSRLTVRAASTSTPAPTASSAPATLGFAFCGGLLFFNFFQRRFSFGLGNFLGDFRSFVRRWGSFAALLLIADLASAISSAAPSPPATASTGITLLLAIKFTCGTFA